MKNTSHKTRSSKTSRKPKDADSRSYYNEPYDSRNSEQEYHGYGGYQPGWDEKDEYKRDWDFERVNRTNNRLSDHTNPSEHNRSQGPYEFQRHSSREEITKYGQHRGKGPKGYQRSDERIQDDISDRLTDDSRIDASNVTLKVENGDVILTGTVYGKTEKRIVEDIAEMVSGVKNVENRLRISRN